MGTHVEQGKAFLSDRCSLESSSLVGGNALVFILIECLVMIKAFYF